MHIDINCAPPSDIFRNRGRYIRIAIALLTLSLGGVALAGYAMLSATPHSDNLETAALVLFVGPALVFVFFGEKLQGYKRLTPEQEQVLVELGKKHTEIAGYCAQVVSTGRRLIQAEFEACQAWAIATKGRQG